METKYDNLADYKLTHGVINLCRLKKWLLLQKNTLEDIQLIITGGEPTIYREWTDFLEWICGNKFKKPILYTNGLNLKDLFECGVEPRNLCKVILTHHLNFKENDTLRNVQLLKELNMDFLVKILIDEHTDNSAFAEKLSCKHIIEGIRKIMPEDWESRKKIIEKYPSPLTGESPYAWRWNGYGSKINREKFKWTADNFILSVDIAGDIFNCHLFKQPIGNIYEMKKMENLQPALCMQVDESYDQNNFENNNWHCETMHYVSLLNRL